MAESTLSIKWSDIADSLSRYLGYGRRYYDVSVALKQDDVFECAKSGYRQFLHRALIQDEKVPHDWSFLRLIVTTATERGTISVTLDSGFGGIIDGTIVLSGSGPTTEPRPLQLISANSLQEMQYAEATVIGTPNGGIPKYAAVVTLAQSPTTESAPSELWLYPTPDADYQIEVRHNILVNAPTANDLLGVDGGGTDGYPIGGMVHGETILASCLAVAEQRFRDEETTNRSRFLDLLTASVEMDKRAAADAAGPVWPITSETDSLGLCYFDFMMATGGYLEIGYSPHIWTFPQERMVHSFIQSGYRQFLVNPVLMPGEKIPHQWNFLRPVTTLTTVASYSTGKVDITLGETTVTLITHSEGTITIVNGEKTVTLTGSTWPDWAATGGLVVDSVVYEVASKTSDTTLVLAEAWALTGVSGKSYVLRSGTWPSWSTQPVFGELVVDGVTYDVASRTDDTNLELVDSWTATSADDSTYSFQRPAYDLGTGCTAIEGVLTYQPVTGFPAVDIIDEGQVRVLRQTSNSVGRPIHAALRPKSSPIDGSALNTFEIMFWPTPDAAYLLSYRYQIVPNPLDETNKFPLGGPVHAETLKASCLAVAEAYKGVVNGPHAQNFQLLMRASITHDRRAYSAEHLGYNADFSDDRFQDTGWNPQPTFIVSGIPIT